MMKPSSALNTTAVTANRQLWKMTSWKVLRWSRNAKFPRPTNCGHLLVQHAEIDGVERRIDHQRRDHQHQRQAHQEADRRPSLRQSLQAAAARRVAGVRPTITPAGILVPSAIICSSVGRHRRIIGGDAPAACGGPETG